MPSKQIVRPSQAKATAAAKKAEKLESEGLVRVVLEVKPTTRHALHTRALADKKTLRAYLLDLAKKDGVEFQERVD